MRIHAAKIQNYMGVKTFDATFDEEQQVVEITGKNGEGKTSSLDAIWAALGGGKHIAKVPIREGEEAATIELNLGHIMVTRKFKRKDGVDQTTQLTVSTPEGALFPKPQQVLDNLFNTIAIDPIEFLRKDPKEQTITFRALIPDFDFVENEEDLKAKTQDRTDANREVKQLQTRFEAFAKPMNAPEAYIDDTDLLEQLTTAQTRNQERQDEISRREACKQEAEALRKQGNAQSVESAQVLSKAKDDGQRLIEKAKAEAVRLQSEAKEQAEQLRKSSKQAHDDANIIEARLAEEPPLPDAINPIKLKEQLDEAKASNALFAKKQQYESLQKELRERQVRASDLDREVRQLRLEAEQAVTKAKLPVPGMGFDDNGLTYKGLPLSQASKAEQIRVCCAIAAALNPELRICRISDGSLLDQDSFALLEGFAKEYDMQVFIETVESSRDGAIVIEAGEIVSQH